MTNRRRRGPGCIIAKDKHTMKYTACVKLEAAKYHRNIWVIGTDHLKAVGSS